MEVVQNFYRYVVDDIADRRSDEYLLALSPWRPIGIFLLYLLVVKKILPDYMRHRQAFQIDKLILFYNFTQILFNAYLLWKIMPILSVMSPVCAPVDHSDSPSSREQLDLCYLYYILKVYDLLDTVFFILRKKERQVTHLHLYHHAMMVTFPWVALRYVPGGNTIYVGALNTTVHIVMYFYYGYTLWNSGASKNVWWKKHLTQLQLFQFAAFSLMGLIVFLHPRCSFPKLVVFIAMTQNMYLTYLFGSFYYNTYIKKKQPSAEAKKIK